MSNEDLLYYNFCMIISSFLFVLFSDTEKIKPWWNNTYVFFCVLYTEKKRKCIHIQKYIRKCKQTKKVYKRPVKEKPLSNFSKINCVHFIMCAFWKDRLKSKSSKRKTILYLVLID